MPKERIGKTRRDKNSGAWSNRFHNRAQRDVWQKSGEGNKSFPRFSCNGKKNRSRVTIGKNTQIDPTTKEERK